MMVVASCVAAIQKQNSSRLSSQPTIPTDRQADRPFARPPARPLGHHYLHIETQTIYIIFPQHLTYIFLLFLIISFSVFTHTN